MRIIEESCDRCGKCEVECHRNAIIRDQSGQLAIDASLCNECAGLLDFQCARVCSPGAIVKSPLGAKPEKIVFDTVIRLRPDHLLYLVAIIGAKEIGPYIGGRESQVLRSLIAKADQDPELEIRIVPTFDDVCIGCSAKKDPRHVEQLTREDQATLNILKYRYGDVVRFWDALNTVRENVTPSHLKSIEKPEALIEDFNHAILPPR